MRILIRLLAGLLALGVLGLAGAAYYVDSLARRGFEAGASHALGVPARLGSARIGLLTGSVRMGDLRVSNPPGFDGDFIFAFDDARFEVPPATLRQPVIHVPLLALSGVDVALERNRSGSNVDAILANLKRFESGGAPPPEKPAGAGRRFVIDELVIGDITAWVDVADPTGRIVELDRVEVEIPEIRLRKVGDPSAGGLSSAQLTDLIVKAILVNVARHGGELGPQVIGGLVRGLKPLDAVSGLTSGVAGTTGKVLEGATGEIERGAGRIAEKLGGLFRREKR
jgi:hypothetical protein